MSTAEPLPPEQAPILVIGMSRSGTSLLINLLAFADEVHAENEPHLLWKSGSFGSLSDEDVARAPDAIRHIRNTLLKRAGKRRLAEKSPPNYLRPRLVHAAFPDAKILLIERDPVACIRSNLQWIDRRNPLALKHLRYKYFSRKRGADSTVSGPESRSFIHEQVRRNDMPMFGLYAARLAWLRKRGLLPFGPRLSGFAEIIGRHGMIDYYVRTVLAWHRYRPVFEQLYGENARFLTLEELNRNGRKTLTEIADFCGISKKAMSFERALGDIKPGFTTPRPPDEVSERIAARLAEHGVAGAAGVN